MQSRRVLRGAKKNKATHCFRRSFSNCWNFLEDRTIIGVQRSSWRAYGRIITHERHSTSWYIYSSWFRRSFPLWGECSRWKFSILQVHITYYWYMDATEAWSLIELHGLWWKPSRQITHEAQEDALTTQWKVTPEDGISPLLSFSFGNSEEAEGASVVIEFWSSSRKRHMSHRLETSLLC